MQFPSNGPQHTSKAIDPTPKDGNIHVIHVQGNIYMLTGDGSNIAVQIGEQGALAGMAAGAVFVDHTTASAAVARELHAQAAQAGIAFVDAPVSGGAQGAVDATLAIMAGGEAAVLERVRPLLDCLGQRIVHIGPNGAGQVAKACNQMIMVAAIQAFLPSGVDELHARPREGDYGVVRD